jgi:hypothetical protein
VQFQIDSFDFTLIYIYIYIYIYNYSFYSICTRNVEFSLNILILENSICKKNVIALI